jgi:hypothetical protein
MGGLPRLEMEVVNSYSLGADAPLPNVTNRCAQRSLRFAMSTRRRADRTPPTGSCTFDAATPGALHMLHAKLHGLTP